LVGLAGNDVGPQGRIRRQHAMEANEMESETWDEGGQAFQECQWVYHEMSGPIAIRRFELKDDLAGRSMGAGVCGPGRDV
jgi:hypothetical protein